MVCSSVEKSLGVLWVQHYLQFCHPQINPAKRVNYILKTILRGCTKNDQRKLELHLAKFVFVIRIARHDITGFTPFDLNFERKIKVGGIFSVLLCQKVKY